MELKTRLRFLDEQNLEPKTRAKNLFYSANSCEEIVTFKGKQKLFLSSKGKENKHAQTFNDFKI